MHKKQSSNVVWPADRGWRFVESCGAIRSAVMAMIQFPPALLLQALLLQALLLQALLLQALLLQALLLLPARLLQCQPILPLRF